MRALAEYVMRGRTEAVIAAVLTTGTVLFAWVGAAVIALVTLRKGPGQGGKVLAWAMLPAIAVAAVGDSGPLTTLLGALMVAVVLRSTASWSWSLMAATLWGVIAGLLLLLFRGPEVELFRQALEQFLQLLLDYLAQGAAGAAPGNELQKVEQNLPGPAMAAGMMGMFSAFAAILCLMLARWWQAVLYNPGGFRDEFHRLRLEPRLAIFLLVVSVAVFSQGHEFRTWAMIFALPFVFAGFALVHGLAARSKLSGNWLGLFYFFWLLLDPVKILLVLLAVADSWLDFRSRVGSDTPES